jgi:negative regulator of sigma E activity
MSAEGMRPDQFERRLSAALEESVLRVEPHVRARLRQARQAAVAEAETRRQFIRWPMFLPATGALAAAVLVTLAIVSRHSPERTFPIAENGTAVLEDIDLLTDSEALELIENWDSGFYEWAAAQGGSGGV